MAKTHIDDRGYYEYAFAYLCRFVKMNHTDFELLLPYLEIRRFDKKKEILKKGDTEDYLNLVMKGLVRKYLKTPRGEITIQLAIEGHIVQSEISFHKRLPSEVILDTLESTVLLSMQYDRLQEALEKVPGAEDLGRAIIMHMFIKRDARYFEQLSKTTRERFLEYMDQHPHMLQRVPQKILASYLDIKPETFSRLKHILRKK